MNTGQQKHIGLDGEPSLEEEIMSSLLKDSQNSFSLLRFTCKDVDIVSQAGDHVFLLDWGDASSGVNHQDIQSRETFCTLDG